MDKGVEVLEDASLFSIPAPAYGCQSLSTIVEDDLNLVDRDPREEGVRTVELLEENPLVGPLPVLLGGGGALELDPEDDDVLLLGELVDSQRFEGQGNA